VSTFQNASRTMETRVHQQLPHLKLKFQKRMHLSLSYLCCLTKEESDAAQAVLQDMITQHLWSPISVRFDKIQCWHETPSSVTTIITVDQPSQCQLMKILRQVEDQLQAKGIPVWIPRHDQMPFHVTLVGLRRGDNVESYQPENAISPDLSSIYNLVHQVSNDHQGLWNGVGGMIVGHPPWASGKEAELHTEPLKDIH
jgi:hypothetical protein